MSVYQTLKLILVDIFDISKDGFHIILGFGVFLVFSHIFKISLSSWKAIVPTVLFSIILELIDFRDSSVFNTKYDFIDSIHDIFITNLIPFLTIIFSRIKSTTHHTDEHL